MIKNYQKTLWFVLGLTFSLSGYGVDPKSVQNTIQTTLVVAGLNAFRQHLSPEGALPTVNLGDIQANFYEQWFEAVAAGNLESVRRLIADAPIIGADLNTINNDGNTALHLAALEGHTEMVKLLINHRDIKLNVKNNDGNTALHLAALEGHTEMVKLLINHRDIKLNIKNKDGDTALHLAAPEEYNTEMVKLLINHRDIKLNVKNNDDNTALHLAALGGHTEIVELLINHRDINLNVQNKNDNTALHLAVLGGHTEIVKLLMKHRGINLNVKNNDNNTALHLAVLKGKHEIVELLINHRDINLNVKNNDGNTALHLAVLGGKPEIVELLINRDEIELMVMNKDGNTALHLVFMKSHVDLAKMLVNRSDFLGAEIVKLGLRHDWFLIVLNRKIMDSLSSRTPTLNFCDWGALFKALLRVTNDANCQINLFQIIKLYLLLLMNQNVMPDSDSLQSIMPIILKAINASDVFMVSLKEDPDCALLCTAIQKACAAMLAFLNYAGIANKEEMIQKIKLLTQSIDFNLEGSLEDSLEWNEVEQCIIQ